MHGRAKAMHIGQEVESVCEVWKVSQIETTFRMGSWNFCAELSSNKLTVIKLPFQHILKRINRTSGTQDTSILLKTAHAENWIRDYYGNL
ncbi:hypothetical protein HRI_000712300 [Hibiscus trionum]|uniref:Uncharacterized protein n=1 Tax=Hibiscus trionum TaxID=183268 RepID=A0A9W7LP73_HIBTR|nr:hypothetical protein HRI_000712300 [Hibiscus trionum]